MFIYEIINKIKTLKLMAVYEVNNLIIHKGTDFTKTFSDIVNEDGSPLGITSSYSGVSKLRKHSTSEDSFPFNVALDINEDTITISMASTITSTLPSGRCYFDILLASGENSTTKKYISGTLIVQDTCSL